MNMATRNHGIDALKIISMYMVVLLHIISHGGVLGGSQSTLTRYVVLSLQTAAYCAVDLFGMTSGYLMANRKPRYARLVELWMQIVFYGLVITLLARFAFGMALPASIWGNVLLPVTFKTYWYFSAYFGLFLLIPFINRALGGLSAKQDRTLAGVLLVITLICTFSPTDPFAMDNGYGLLWMILLYAAGALIRKYEKEINLKPVWLLLGYVLTVAAIVTSISLIKRLDIPLAQNQLLHYDSVLVVATAVMLMLLFGRIKLPAMLQKVTTALSPLSFSVYIIHEQPIVRAAFVKGRFAFLGSCHWVWTIFGVLLFGVGIYAVCTAIEAVRIKLFAALGIGKLSSRIGDAIDRVLGGEA